MNQKSEDYPFHVYEDHDYNVYLMQLIRYYSINLVTSRLEFINDLLSSGIITKDEGLRLLDG